MQAIGEERNWQQWWSPAFLFQKTGPSLSMKDWIDTQILSSRTRQLLNLVVEMDGYPLPLLRSGCHQRLVLFLSLSYVVEMPYLSLIPFVYFIFISANLPIGHGVMFYNISLHLYLNEHKCIYTQLHMDMHVTIEVCFHL